MGGFKTIDSYNETVKELSEYISSTLPHGAGGDVKKCIEAGAKVSFTMPTKPTPVDPSSVTAVEESLLDLYKYRMKDFVQRTREMDTACRTTYSLAYGQCSPTVRAKLEALSEYKDVAAEDDLLALLKLIQGAMMNFQGSVYVYDSLDDIHRKSRRFVQKPHWTLREYKTKFLALQEAVEQFGAATGQDPAAIKYEIAIMAKELDTDITLDGKDGSTKASADQLLAAIGSTKEKSKAVAFLTGADSISYGAALDDLRNDFLKGDDKYPKDVEGAYAYLYQFRSEARRQVPSADHTEGISFVNDGSVDSGSNTEGDSETDLSTEGGGRTLGPCWFCEGPHLKHQCPKWIKKKKKLELEKKKEKADKKSRKKKKKKQDSSSDESSASGSSKDSHSNVTIGPEEPGNGWTLSHYEEEEEISIVTKDRRRLICKWWTLLDSESSINMFKNEDLVENIRVIDKTATVHCNAGVRSTNRIADYSPGGNYFGDVWFDDKAIANILSLSKVKELFRVTYDSGGGRYPNTMVVHLPTTKMFFKESPTGLYYHDAREECATMLVGEVVPTVEQKKSLFTDRQVRGATFSRRAQDLVGNPSPSDFKGMGTYKERGCDGNRSASW
eukprot:CAMPEP_0194330290 /NCGR_PEP_ID=MMETSP0171-20130528/51403_1 /TAXON_ID=218684 /ORGANISM="Corethron pennatum, Strain L29A3" /LENGTH=612 /DNA_ID=CAMNT_0039091343 /DNA_START=237 /DNA_END=2075 /DNA_ORIENTATION=+